MNWRVVFLLSVLVAGAVTPAGGKEFKDWSVWCTNALQCTMQTLGAQSGPLVFLFGFERGPQANAAIVPVVNLREPPEGDFMISVELDNTPEPFILKSASAQRTGDLVRFAAFEQSVELLEAVMAAGKMQLVFSTEGETRRIDVSVSGATASALYLDEVQGRAGNRDAIQARGEGQPRDAQTRSARLSAQTQLPSAVLKAWQGNNGECSESFDDRDLIAVFGGTRIEGKEGAQLFLLPCGLPGAYNMVHSAYVHSNSEGGLPGRRLYFPTMAANGPTIMENAINADWDELAGQLHGRYKGRGLGDCGFSSVWSWDGYYYSQLVLVEEHAKDDCDGKYDDWPQVWPPRP